MTDLRRGINKVFCEAFAGEVGPFPRQVGPIPGHYYTLAEIKDDLALGSYVRSREPWLEDQLLAIGRAVAVVPPLGPS